MPDTTEKSLTEKTIEELEIDCAECATLRQRLSAEKQALQGQLAEINAACIQRLPNKEFQRIRSKRFPIVRQLADKEVEIAEANRIQAEIHAVKEVRKRQAGRIVPSDIRSLVGMRDRWHEFSMDPKNHQKSREVAWKVSQELREFLKPHFKPD